MQNTLRLALVISLAVTFGSCTKITLKHLPRQDWGVIEVWLDGTTCKVREEFPTEIRTQPGRRVTWVIQARDGKGCPDSRIAIDPMFAKVKGGPDKHQIVSGLPAEGVAGTPGNVISGTVRDDLPPGLQKGHYRFQILIDKARAQFNSFAREGDFFLCPVWPCGDFKDY